MKWTAFPALLVLACPAAAPAQSSPTWGYEVFTTVAPAQLVGSGSGLSATEVVTLNMVLNRPTLVPPVLPDPLAWRWDSYERSLSTVLLVKFLDETSGQHTWDTASWRVTSKWVKADEVGEPPRWEYQGETDHLITRWGDNYVGGPRANRYDLEITQDGSLRLSMLPDVENVRYVPEPGTVALAVVGLSGLAVASTRRRRRKYLE